MKNNTNPVLLFQPSLLAKYMLVAIISLGTLMFPNAQVPNPTESVTFSIRKGSTDVRSDAQGALFVNISPKMVRAFKRRGEVRYSDFGAKGDGTTDDINAIAATHAFANEHHLPVRADEGFTYYIKSDERTAVVQTDTDFGTASFTIDDTEVIHRGRSVFSVTSRLQPFRPEGLTSLSKNQQKIDIDLARASLITVTNADMKRYIRYGRNQNNGRGQTDIFLVDKQGNVDLNAPIIWDFDQITEITALPIDENKLTITGGRFTTIANQAESKYNYHSRNIDISRSNVSIEGLEHRIIGEGDHGAPYRGFISIRDCSNVTVRNTTFTGHKKYSTIGSAGLPVSMGSYDISVNRALNVSFIDCKQFNSIDDRDYWGVMASNFSKNILYDNCTFSRFDAHMGVANATIRNSTLGHMGINAIGNGLLTVEDCTIRGRGLINLRSDYGSTWQGDLIIRNCTLIPGGGEAITGSIIRGRNNEQHDFGYTCYMPKKITIENLHIDDSSHPQNYEGPTLFDDFNSQKKDDTYEVKYPYVLTEEVVLKNVTTASGFPLRLSDNLYMFRDIKVTNK